MTTFTSDLRLKDKNLTPEDKMKRRKEFQKDIRRSEHTRQIYDTNLKWLLLSTECPTRLKDAIKNCLNANRRLHVLILDHYKNQQVKEIHEELSSEYLKDLNLILDEFSTIPDLSGIIEAIQKSKTI